MQQAIRLPSPAHKLTPLPYGLDALAPHISRETIEYHYGKHHRAYVNKLNELTNGTELEHMPLADLVTQTTGTVFNNAAQAWNHDFYWNCLRPGIARGPQGDLAAAIDASFGAFEVFANLFKSNAASKFGSGWTWLVKNRDGRLAIRNSNDAENPLLWGQVPLLVCDVWEHAYYIDYRNDRARYVDAFWRLANWDFAARNFADQ